MKTNNILLLIAVYFLSSYICEAQWQQDVRLTNNPANSVTDRNRHIAVNGDIVHVVWTDTRDGNQEIYFKRSINSGTNWESDVRLTNNSALSNTPVVAVSGNVVHVVWTDDRDGNYEIYYKRSLNGGVSWETDIRLSNDSFYSISPSLTVSGTVVHVVWSDERDGGAQEIYYKRSPDGGNSWGSETRLSNTPSSSNTPAVTVSGSVVHLVWADFVSGQDEIYYKRSMNAGISWEADTRLTYNASESYHPSIAVSGSIIHLVWRDNRDGNYEIYYKQSLTNGGSWGGDTRLTNDPGSSEYPFVEVFGSAVHIVWRDSRDTLYETYYKRSTNEGFNWGADTRLTYSSGSTMMPSMALSGAILHVVWADSRDGNNEIYYKRNPTGNSTSTTFRKVGVNKTIMDLSFTYDTLFTFQGMNMSPFYVNDISLTIDTVLHTKDSDLEISLIHQSVTDTVIYQVGGTGANFIGTVLDDSASTPIANGTAPFTGTYKPTKPLSQLINTDPDGAWILRIYDRATGNTGMLNAWSLTLTVSQSPIGISQINTEVPEGFKLYQNYPNPFNPSTKIRFSTPLNPPFGKGGTVRSTGGLVTLKVYDILGREVATLVNGQLNPGTYEVDFNGSNFASGIYFYKLSAGDGSTDSPQGFTETKKMILIK